MKKLILFVLIFSLHAVAVQSLYAENDVHDTTSVNNKEDAKKENIAEWFKSNKISLRKSFDGGKDENAPARFIFFSDLRSSNDYVKVDAAIKIKEYAPPMDNGRFAVIYPAFEWHRSTDSSDIKNSLKVSGNVECLPFAVKYPGLKNGGMIIAPLFKFSTSLSRNFIEDVWDVNITGQVAGYSKYEFFPGFPIRSESCEYIGRYYPYVGLEYNIKPDLITEDKTEKFTVFFTRLYLELFPFCSEYCQLVFDGSYKENITGSSDVRKVLSVMSVAGNLYFLPDKEICIGYEFKYGYDSNSKYQLVKTSSITFGLKF